MATNIILFTDGDAGFASQCRVRYDIQLYFEMAD